MPCYDSRDEDDRKEAQNRLNKATRVACELAKLAVRHGYYARLTPVAKAWIEEHDELDRKHKAEENRRRARQRERKAAIAKLTPEERIVLGVRDYD